MVWEAAVQEIAIVAAAAAVAVAVAARLVRTEAIKSLALVADALTRATAEQQAIVYRSR